MSQSERAFRSIAVFGGGIVAWSAALAFARALPRASVSIVETAVDAAALADRLPCTLPDVSRFHAAIGLDEIALVRDGIALHRLGTRFEGWSTTGEPWVHAFGDYGLPHDNVPFHLIWSRARAAGGAVPKYHEHSAAAVLASAHKFAHPSDDPRSPLSTYTYGLRLDPELYLQRLRALHGAATLQVSPGEIGELERHEDGRIAAVRLRDGRRVEADLFVDCTGPSAQIIGAMGGIFESWSDLFPFAAVEIGFAGGEPSPLDVATAEADGWTWRLPLPRRTMLARARSGAGASYGWRPDPWVANLLAIGDSAASIDPIAGSNLHLAHGAVLRALELLPGRDCHPIELAEYNRRTRQAVGRVRDFAALHYARSGRSDAAWRVDANLPGSLARTLEQFEQRGHLPFFEDESFTPHSWAAALLGLGVMPRVADPRAERAPVSTSIAGMERMAARLRATAERVPPYRGYLERMRAAPARLERR